MGIALDQWQCTYTSPDGDTFVIAFGHVRNVRQAMDRALTLKGSRLHGPVAVAVDYRTADGCTLRLDYAAPVPSQLDADGPPQRRCRTCGRPAVGPLAYCSHNCKTLADTLLAPSTKGYKHRSDTVSKIGERLL